WSELDVWICRAEARPAAHCHRFRLIFGPMKRLAGKTALVTGAGRGIGRAPPTLFAQEGANLVVLDRAPAVEDTAAAIRQSGGKALAFVKDSSDESAIAAAIDAAVSEFGALDVCYANAGVSGGWVPMQEQTPSTGLRFSRST